MRLHVYLAALAALLLNVAPGGAAEALNEEACQQINGEIPLVLKNENNPYYYAAVIYSRSVDLEEGQTVLVLSELQAINETSDWVMLGTFITVSEEPFTAEPFRLKDDRPERVSAALGDNITPQRHYGLASRHGLYSAPADGTYYLGLVAYSASNDSTDHASLGVQEDACSLDVIALE